MIEALGYVSLDEPDTAHPMVIDFPQCRMASSFWPKSMGMGAKLEFEIRI